MIPGEERQRLTPVQLLGLFMWRGGLLLVASYTFFRIGRLMLTYVDLPIQLEVGIGLALAGAAMVILSLILERMQDAGREKELTE